MSTIHGETTKEVEAETKTRMHKALEDLHREMATIRTGRASPDHSRRHSRELPTAHRLH